MERDQHGRKERSAAVNAGDRSFRTGRISAEPDALHADADGFMQYDKTFSAHQTIDDHGTGSGQEYCLQDSSSLFHKKSPLILRPVTDHFLEAYRIGIEICSDDRLPDLISFAVDEDRCRNIHEL